MQGQGERIRYVRQLFNHFFNFLTNHTVHDKEGSPRSRHFNTRRRGSPLVRVHFDARRGVPSLIHVRFNARRRGSPLLPSFTSVSPLLPLVGISTPPCCFVAYRIFTILYTLSLKPRPQSLCPSLETRVEGPALSLTSPLPTTKSLANFLAFFQILCLLPTSLPFCYITITKCNSPQL